MLRRVAGRDANGLVPRASLRPVGGGGGRRRIGSKSTLTRSDAPIVT